MQNNIFEFNAVVLGDKGCGKSTFISLLTGIYKTIK